MQATNKQHAARTEWEWHFQAARQRAVALCRRAAQRKVRPADLDDMAADAISAAWARYLRVRPDQLGQREALPLILQCVRLAVREVCRSGE